MADDRLSRRTFDAQYGLEFLVAEAQREDAVRGRVRVRADLLNQHGVVHGGVFASAAEALAWRGTVTTVLRGGGIATVMSNDTTVVEAVSEGFIHADARVEARTDDVWLWTVRARDDQGRLCAVSHVAVAVR